MSEQFLIENLDRAVDETMSHEPVTLVIVEASLKDLLSLVEDLCDLPREDFKTALKEDLIRRATMTTEAQRAPEQKPAIQAITPYLTVERAEELVEFVKQAFGAVEVFRTTGSAGGMHAEVTIGDSRLMIGGMPGVTEIPTALHLYVPDADAVYQRSMEAGGTSLEEPVDQFYGDREAGVKDPTGNVWWIATHKLGPAGTHVPEGLGTVTPFLHPVGAAKFIDFMKEAFGAEEVSRYQSPDGVIQHATVRIGNSMMEMGEAHGDAQPMPPALYTYVEDVDASYERAIKAGATSLQPPTDQAYGDRTAWVKDAWENIWYLAKSTNV
ncbi:MAG: VOC family protein [Pyrinomonadaceae bacterium]